MRLKELIAISAVVLAPVAAHGAPTDVQPVSAARVHRQLDALAKTLEHYHPYLKSAAERKRFNARVGHLLAPIRGEIPVWKDWLLQQELVRTLNDPHTTTYPLALERRVLPVKIHWVSNGILISPWHSKAKERLFPKDSQLLRLGPYDPKAFLRKEEALFSGPAEWIKVSDALPGYEMYWFGLVDAKGGVAMTVRTPAGRVRHLTLKFVTLPKNWLFKKIAKRDRRWYHWRLDRAHNIAWFTLNQMRVAVKYDKAVVAFFRAVKRAHITRVAVDLRKNGGGSSLAEVPFLQYMGVKHYKDYGEKQSLSPKVLKAQFGELEAYMKKNLPKFYVAHFPVPKAPSAKNLFHGKLYLVTGPGCFSSAMEFAEDVKYNHIGTLIGSPCGETVTGPGEVHEFIHNSPSGVPFQVSTTVYHWPGLQNGAMVEPGIRIPLTMADVRKGIDPVSAWFDASDHSAEAAHTPRRHHRIWRF